MRAHHSRSQLALISGLLALVLWPSHPVRSQAVKGKVSPQDPPPPLTYHGLIPGLSTAEQVRQALGAPAHEARWYAYKMLYPAERRPGMFDAVYLHGQNGTFANVEAASIPKGFETEKEILARFSQPEYCLRMATFSMLDYSAKGVRFILDRSRRTIGVAYFPHLRRRVHPGARRFVDLSGLRQGAQPRPKKAAALNALRAGISKIKISPASAEWLAPQLRARYKPHDDMWARCVVFEQGGTYLALVGADLFGMSASDIWPIRRKVAEKGVQEMVLAMSHNHSAPDTIGVYGFYPNKYIDYIQKQIIECVIDAKDHLRPVKEFRAASRELPMDGARVMGYFRNARNSGVLDPTLSVLQAIGDDNRPIATIVNFACHVEGIEAGAAELSADFPGYMCDQIEKDGGGQAVFLNGAVGGMVSGDGRARTHEEAQKTGSGLAAIVKDLLASAQPPATFAVTVQHKLVEIPMTNPRFKPLVESGRAELYRGRVRTEMTLIRLAEAEILTLPGELLPEVSFEILEKMNGFPRILAGLANDEIGYIIPADDFRDDEYEETMSLGPAAAPLIRDTALRLLLGIK